MSEAIIAHWEVTRAENAGQKSNPHGGQLDKWYVGLRNLDGGGDCEDAYWQRKSPSEVTVGDHVYGKIEEGDYGLRFYLEKDEEGGSRPRNSRPSESSTGTSSKGDTDWEVRNAEIRRQHSQEMAVRMLDIYGAATNNASVSFDQTQGWLQQWADWFDQDAVAAGQKASTGLEPRLERIVNHPMLNKEQSVDFSGARKEEPGNTLDHEHILQLLSSAGVVYAGAREKIADYIGGPLLVAGREKKALSGLQDLDRQGTVLAQLKAETEEWIGGPLPQGDALDGDSSIPF